MRTGSGLAGRRFCGDRRLAEGLRQVKTRLKADAVEVLCASAQDVMRSLAPDSLDLVFLDPPYGQGLLRPALEAAARHNAGVAAPFHVECLED